MPRSSGAVVARARPPAQAISAPPRCQSVRWKASEKQDSRYQRTAGAQVWWHDCRRNHPLDVICPGGRGLTLKSPVTTTEGAPFLDNGQPLRVTITKKQVESRAVKTPRSPTCGGAAVPIAAGDQRWRDKAETVGRKCAAPERPSMGDRSATAYRSGRADRFLRRCSLLPARAAAAEDEPRNVRARPMTTRRGKDRAAGITPRPEPISPASNERAYPVPHRVCCPRPGAVCNARRRKSVSWTREGVVWFAAYIRLLPHTPARRSRPRQPRQGAAPCGETGSHDRAPPPAVTMEKDGRRSPLRHADRSKCSPAPPDADRIPTTSPSPRRSCRESAAVYLSYRLTPKTGTVQVLASPTGRILVDDKVWDRPSTSIASRWGAQPSWGKRRAPSTGARCDRSRRHHHLAVAHAERGTQRQDRARGGPTASHLMGDPRDGLTEGRSSGDTSVAGARWDYLVLSLLRPKSRGQTR